MTYSIVARDPDTGELGVAVQTRWFNVGNGVPWLAPGVGAVATQSFTEVAHGPNGLALLGAGRSPAEALAELLATDDDRAQRQVGIVDACGRTAAHTGTDCVPEAGHLTEADVSVQANMMERPTVRAAMVAAFRSTSGDLAARLLGALDAAEREGGDVRGRQSAALLVAPGTAGARSWERRFDLRVEDSRDPLGELARLLRLARAYEAFEQSEQALAAGAVARAFELSAAARELAPEDDQLQLWHAVALVGMGSIGEARSLFRAAATAEPRAPEHLRRFARAGQLPEAERVLAELLGD